MPGLVLVKSNSELDAEAAALREAEEVQSTPLLQGLAAHLYTLWEPARYAQSDLRDAMLKAMRQRKGEYEPDKLAQIRQQGGSEVYMMVTDVKCRGAESWLRDVLMDEGMIPFDVKPTPKPGLPPEEEATITKRFAEKVIQVIQQTGMAPASEEMEHLKDTAYDDRERELLEEATERAERMRMKIEDQFVEGGLVSAFDAFLTDLSTYRNAWIKGPIVRRQKVMRWKSDGQGGFIANVGVELKPTYNRCDPFRMYTEPGISSIHEGYLFEHHRLSRPELSELIGCPGYDDNAIRAVLDTMSYGGALTSWVDANEQQKSELENKPDTWNRPTEVCDALEFWGKIPGSKLREWGMTEQEIPDPAAEYDVNAWIIDRWVIKAVLNYDPLGRKPYYTTSFIKRPGSLYGAAVPEVIEDIQQMCNAAARALANNMGLASGPLVEVNIERLAGNEKVTTLRPWQIYQTLNDPLGSGQPAVHFNQPDDRSQPLMMVYQHFLKLADDQSGIPAYVYGDMQVGGAGRTSSGLSMLMGAAGKGIRQVVMYIDRDIIEQLVQAQYNWNMRYVDDPMIKGDSMVVAKGAIVLANREQQNVRRVEFAQMTANEIDQQIMGLPGRAALLREVAKGLSMPADEIIPSKDKLELKEAMMQMQAQQEAMQPQSSVEFQRDEQGQVKSANVFPGGAKMGGQEGNVVSNKQTGRAA